MNIGALVQLSHTYKAMQFEFEARRFEMTVYDKEAMIALLGRLTGLGIEDLYTRWHVGDVYSFSAHPFYGGPTLLLCKKLDLSGYYSLWAGMVTALDSDLQRKFLPAYDAMMNYVIRSARNLDDGEVHYMISEMLIFRNEQIVRVSK